MFAQVSTRIQFGYVKFFRNQLLILDSDGISQMVDRMDKETRNIRQEILKLCWYMRGGLTYDEGMQLGFQEREIISDIVKDNLETTKKSGLPFF
jgi:hypothetical protein